MRKRDAFAGLHPVVNFLYFMLVIVCAMALQHPLCLSLSLLGGFCYAVRLTGRRAVGVTLRFLLPLMLLTALINPLFSHEGVTILWYFPSGNPLTLESILFGVSSGVMLAAVIGWFSCFNAVMTSDKLVWLFGRVIPAVSLLLSMALRFVPRLRRQAKVVADAQRMLGRDGSGSLRARIKTGVTVFSILVTWALESAIETADSMKSRGYGLPGRSAFSLYRFTGRDRLVLAVLLALGAYLVAGVCLGALRWQYYPMVKGAAVGAYSISVFISYGIVCGLPLILQWEEDRAWKCLQRTI